jgi:hypothetical protein
MRLIYGRSAAMSWGLELRNVTGQHALSGQGAEIMNNQKGTLGIALGALFAVVALAFILGGGAIGGKKTIDGDEDLPPVAMGALHAQTR